MINPVIQVFWQRYGLAAMLGAVALGFLGAIVYETGGGQAMRLPLPTTSDASRTPEMLATLPNFSMPSLDSAFRETAERPLFTPTRRPSASSSTGQPVMKKGQFKLSGTSVNNDLTVAFLLETATGKTVRVARGKEINGITLDTIEANRVVLKQGEETEELTLRTAQSPPAPPKVALPPPGTAPPPPPGTAPIAPAAAPPVAAAVADPVPQPASRAVPQAQNPLVPAPGQGVLPGFVMPAPASGQAAPSADTNNTAQRRRRSQTTPQQ